MQDSSILTGGAKLEMLFLLVKAPLPAARNHFGSVLPTFCAYVERHRRVDVPEHALDNFYFGRFLLNLFCVATVELTNS